MPPYDEAFFATKLQQALEERHPDLAFEGVSGYSIGGGAVKTIHVRLPRGAYALMPFPRRGLAQHEVELSLYLMACRKLGLQPVGVSDEQ